MALSEKLGLAFCKGSEIHAKSMRLLCPICWKEVTNMQDFKTNACAQVWKVNGCAKSTLFVKAAKHPPRRAPHSAASARLPKISSQGSFKPLESAVCQSSQTMDHK